MKRNKNLKATDMKNTNNNKTNTSKSETECRDKNTSEFDAQR